MISKFFLILSNSNNICRFPQTRRSFKLWTFRSSKISFLRTIYSRLQIGDSHRGLIEWLWRIRKYFVRIKEWFVSEFINFGVATEQVWVKLIDVDYNDGIPKSCPHDSVLQTYYFDGCSISKVLWKIQASWTVIKWNKNSALRWTKWNTPSKLSDYFICDQ